MAFDQQTRNLLQRTVSACRNLLDAEFAAQRRSIFGINDDGTAAPLETLSHLSDEDMQTAKLLRDRLDHLVAGLVSQGKKEAEARKEAVGRVTREQAFTVLNRLAALRMSEEREIVLECVRQGTASEGFALFMQTAGGALGGTFESYRCYLFLLFDELATDLGVLFSRWDPAGLLFPRQEALEAVLRELNGTGSAATREDITPEAFNAIWAEDETIGWIYQYYNDQAERKKMRDESAAPRNSRELAVRNQFFTPRYVVEFLTDNTLGRIWYEMTRGDTTLKEQCRYLVRRPCEVFLKLADDDTPPSCRPWVGEVRSGNLAAARFDATWDEISSVALAIDGQAVAVQLGHGDVHDYASSRRESAVAEGLVDDAPLLDQWLLLISIHNEILCDGQAPQSDAHSRDARKAWEAWFVAARAESFESVSQEDLHNLTMPMEAIQEAHDHIFGKGTDFYPDEWIKRAWQGDLSRLETEFTVDRVGKDADFARRYEEAKRRKGNDSFEGLFVKNLENVQGDERDVMIISTTFGPDSQGKFRRNFGALSQREGGRRLNVLVTRARTAIHVLTSIPVSEYSAVDETPPGQVPNGRLQLYAYLRYTESLAVLFNEYQEELEKMRRDTKPEVKIWNSATPSSLASSLGNTLLKRHNTGAHVHWGNEGFCVDVACIHPLLPADVTVGVLTDFSRFHKTPDPIEWDLFRTRVFRLQGWEIERLWSPVLFRSADEMMQRVKNSHDRLSLTDKGKKALPALDAQA